MERPLALIVDKDPTIRAAIRDVFEESGVIALGAATDGEAMDLLRTRPIRIVTIDGDSAGIDVGGLLDHSLRLEPSPIVIGVLNAGETARAEDWLRAGMTDVWIKPLDDASLQRCAQRTLRHHGLIEEIQRLRDALKRREGYQGLVGRSSQIEAVRREIQRLASSAVPVWFVGEIGSGKELAARTLEARSGGEESPFTVVPCAGLDVRTWEARSGGPGVFGQLSGGAVYLDDLPALDLELQGALLERLGLRGGAAAGPAVRILSSSTVEPRKAMERGRLLEALYRALFVECITLPPLRERVEDIPILARYFITTICTINHLPPIDLAPDALTLLERYGWPENVQELRNAMEQAVILATEGTIRPHDLPDRVREAAPPALSGSASPPSVSRRFRDAKREVVEQFERSYLVALMERHRGNVTAASQQAGMLRSALQRLLRKYGLKSATFRKQTMTTVARDDQRPTR